MFKEVNKALLTYSLGEFEIRLFDNKKQRVGEVIKVPARKCGELYEIMQKEQKKLRELELEQRQGRLL